MEWKTLLLPWLQMVTKDIPSSIAFLSSKVAFQEGIYSGQFNNDSGMCCVWCCFERNIRGRLLAFIAHCPVNELALL